MSDKTVWRLFATATDKVGMRLAEEAPYALVRPGYTLLYTQAEEVEGAVEVPEHHITGLAPVDRDWLIQCAALNLKERLRTERAESGSRLQDLTDRLEEELEKARKRVMES